MNINNTQIAVVGVSIARAAAAFKIKSVQSAQESRVRQYYRKALVRARAQKAASIAFEVSDRGISRDFPLEACAKIMAQEIFRHIHEEKARVNPAPRAKTRGVTGGGVKKILICVPEKKAYAVFKQYALGYLDYIANKLKSPFLTVDAIIEINKGIVVIKRSNPPYGWALPGGFVDYGESLEKAVAREAKEETGLAIKGLKQFHTYSNPKRDPRFHTVGTVFIAKAKGRPKAGDDAAGIKVINLKEIASLEFAFDHKSILKDYIRYRTQTRRFC